MRMCKSPTGNILGGDYGNNSPKYVNHMLTINVTCKVNAKRNIHKNPKMRICVNHSHPAF